VELILTDLNADAMSVFLFSYVSWVLVLMALGVCTQPDRQESFNHMSFSWCMWLLYISLNRSFEGKRKTICWCGLHWFAKKLMLTLLSACCVTSMLKSSKLANCKNSVAEILQNCEAVCCPPNSGRNSEHHSWELWLSSSLHNKNKTKVCIWST
jgi:hypothetical protein